MTQTALIVRLMDALKDYLNLKMTVNGHRFYGTPAEYDLNGVTFEVTSGPHRGERPTVPYEHLESIRPAPVMRNDTLSRRGVTRQLSPLRKAA